MSTLKVLPLPPYVRLECRDYKETTPVFNRDGYYFRNGEAWFELNGKAYCDKAKHFTYDLWYLTTGEYSPDVVNALETICKTGFATKEQRRLWAYLEVHKELNSTAHRKSKLNAIRAGRCVRAKLAELKAKRALEARAA